MVDTHRVFLLWLLYLVIVGFGIGVLLYLGLPQIALHYDHSYLTVLLFAMYGTAEALSGRQAWFISQENRITDEVIDWLSHHILLKIIVHPGQLQLWTDNDNLWVSRSTMTEHITELCLKAAAGQRQINQTLIIDIAAERLYARAMIGDFISGRIVWIGILATILGVIMAFWPMLDGATIDTMRTNLGGFFGGIAVAFIPTAVSFACKIVLDVNSRIIASGVRGLIEKIAGIAETTVLPFLHRDGDITVI